MTTITINRATVEQALEALESLFNWRVDPERGKRCGDAVVALRAALAQQAEPVQMRPSQFAEMIKGKEALTGIPVYWAEWPNKEEA